MTEEMVMPGAFLGVAISSYDDESTYQPLPRAVPDMRALAELLAGTYEPAVIPDGDFETIRRELASWSRSTSKEAAIVIWSGHGVQDVADLRLVAGDTAADPLKVEVFEPSDLVDAAVSVADEVLVVIDTCHAGDGLLDALGSVIARAQVTTQGGGRRRWVGVLAACLGYQTAKDGVLAHALLELLQRGPAAAELREPWSRYNQSIRLVPFLAALEQEWSKPKQMPVPVSYGSVDPQLSLPNPLYRPRAPEALASHLLYSAKGVSPVEEGWYFSGRKSALTEIVNWVQRNDPGIFVVTGPAGSGNQLLWAE